MVKPCGNCGLERDVLPTGFCGPCELAIQAMEPPQELKDMQLVYSGQQPRTDSQRQQYDWMKTKFTEFLAHKKGLEREWRAHVRAAQKASPKQSGKKAGETSGVLENSPEGDGARRARESLEERLGRLKRESEVEDERESDKLRKQLVAMAERVAAQSELLSRRAEQSAEPLPESGLGDREGEPNADRS